MKATGIIRRIDDLGRVVIPKEIRRSLNIKEGDPLELYTTEDGVCFRLYDGDFRALVSTYELVALALYKLDVPTALYWQGRKVSGHPSIPEEMDKVNRIHCGTFMVSDVFIGYSENHPTPTQAGALDLLAMTIQQKVIELWGE